MSAHPSHSRQTSRGRQSNNSPMGSRHGSTDKTPHKKRSISSSRHSAVPSIASSQSSYISTSSGSSSASDSSGRYSPEKAQKAIIKADKCMTYLDHLEREDKAYWDKKAASTDDTQSTGSSVFAEMSGFSTKSPGKTHLKNLAKKLSKEAEAVGEEVLMALQQMSWFVPQAEDGKEFSYTRYAKQVRDLMTTDPQDRQRMQSDFLSSRSRKIAGEHQRGCSLMLRAFPPLHKYLEELVKAMQQLKTRSDWAYLTEVRSLLSKSSSHIRAFKNCGDIQETLEDYYNIRGSHRR